MFYHEALDYIRRIEADGSDYGLERERELLDILGSPDTAYPVIHVAGTNGKGSVCAMLTAVLAAAGYRVGTYNSPSVLRYNETVERCVAACGRQGRAVYDRGARRGGKGARRP